MTDNPMHYSPEELAETQATAGELRLGEMRAALLDTQGLEKIPEPEPLIDGIIHRDALVWLIGKSGDGKSFVALDMAGSIGTGYDWHGHKVTQGTVLYIVAEGATGIRWRVRAWEYTHDIDMNGVRWLPRPVQAALEVDWATLIDLVRELDPILVAIDTQARITVGMEENAAKDMGVFVDQLEQLRQASAATVLVVHHQGRNGEHMRGSTALEGAAGTVIRVVKEESEITLTCEKQKDAEPFEEIKLRLVPTLDSAVVMLSDSMSQAVRSDTAASKLGTQWWSLFEDEIVSASKLIEALKLTKPTFYRNVKTLEKTGLAIKEINGSIVRYRLVRSGFENDHLAASDGPVEVRSPDFDESAGQPLFQPQRSGGSDSGPVDRGGPVRLVHTPYRGGPTDLRPDQTPVCQCGQALMNRISIELGQCARCRLKGTPA